MTFLIVGSTAARYWWPGFPRLAKDIDVISFKDQSGLGYDDVFFHPRLEEWMPLSGRCATPSELYTVKLSHSYWELPNGSWNKHIFDILWLQSNGEAQQQPRVIQDFHDALYKCWEGKHGIKKVDLNYDKSEFFDDAVRRVYDHDSLHESVAYGDYPVWMDCLKSGSEVAMDMQKIKSWPRDKQVSLYREEIAATALERWIIPSDYRFSPGLAWKLGLKKTVTSLTKGWSAQFLVENLRHFVTPDDYVSRHLSKKCKLVTL